MDTIAHEGFSKSRVNKIKPVQAEQPVDDETRADEMVCFDEKTVF